MPSGAPLSGPLSVEHAVTKSVRDTALLLDLTSGPAVGAPFGIAPPVRPYVDEVGADPGKLRIGITTTMPGGDPVHPDCAAVASDVGVMLENWDITSRRPRRRSIPRRSGPRCST